MMGSIELLFLLHLLLTTALMAYVLAPRFGRPARTKRIVAARPVREGPVKCNARAFVFQAPDGTGARLKAHPVCEGVPLETLTEDWARTRMRERNPGKDFLLVGVRDEVHFVEPR